MSATAEAIQPTVVPGVKPGDIIGFSGFHWHSVAINLVTYGIPFWSTSHLAIVGEHDGQPALFESQTRNGVSCLIQGRAVGGVQCRDIGQRINHYQGRIWHYPLVRPLYDHERERLNQFLTSKVGLHYDYFGAFRAGGNALSWLESHLRDEDLSSFFCSEFVAAALIHVGLLQSANASRWNPNRLVRELRRRQIVRRSVRLK